MQSRLAAELSLDSRENVDIIWGANVAANVRLICKFDQYKGRKIRRVYKNDKEREKDMSGDALQKDQVTVS